MFLVLYFDKADLSMNLFCRLLGHLFLHPTDSDQKFSFKLMSEESMLRSLKMLKSGKAPGPDGVPTNLVKDAAKFIAKPLAMIFNASLAKGIVPNVWKLAKINIAGVKIAPCIKVSCALRCCFKEEEK